MANVLLCTQDALLVKGLENPLRDAGHEVASATAPAQAVRMVLDRPFDLVVLDSEVVGMSATVAASVIREVAPGARALIRGDIPPSRGIEALPHGSGLAELKAAILHAVHPSTWGGTGDET